MKSLRRARLLRLDSLWPFGSFFPGGANRSSIQFGKSGTIVFHQRLIVLQERILRAQAARPISELNPIPKLHEVRWSLWPSDW
jgi:hypothetical protein